jgi:hypothetical protein
VLAQLHAEAAFGAVLEEFLPGYAEPVDELDGGAAR